jgi:hypothetical protein
MKQQLQKVLSFLHSLRADGLYKRHVERRESMDIITNVIKGIDSLNESIADISQMAGHYGYYSGDSRADIQLFIDLAKEFESIHKDRVWGITDDKDYMEEIEKFALRKLKLKPKLILHYPRGLESWTSLSIEKCREEKGSTIRLSEYPSKAKDKPNDFWSVYAKQTDGTTMCVADLPDSSHATDLYNTIVDAVKNFKGHKEKLKKIPT